MKTLKTALAALAGVVVLYAAAAWYVGMRAESMVEELVERGNARLTRMLGESAAGHAHISDYQRGVFSSQLRYTLDLDGLGLGGDAPQTVEFQIDLQHGPFPWSLVRGGDFAPQLIAGHIRLLPTPLTQPWFDVAGEDALRAQARVGFSQDGRAQVTIAPIVLEQDGNALRFSGAQLNVTYVNQFADSEVSGGFASLDITEDGQDRVRVRDATITGRTHQDDDVAQSESHLEIASIRVSLDDVPESHVEAFGIDFALEQAGSLMDYSVQYRLGKTNILGRDLGAFDLGISAKQVDVLAVMALSHLLESVEPGLTGVEIDRDELEAQVGNLLKAQPTIILDPLRWRTDKGESRAALTADLFLPQEDDAVDFDDFGLQYLRQANVSLEVSRTMVLHVAQLLQKNANPLSRAMFAMLFEQYANRLQRAGLVQIDGDTVSLRASYRGEDESIELNGERMSLDELILRMMQFIRG